MDEELDLFGWVGGTVDGKYRVDRVVGRGGFGVVYQAHHLGFDQTVALKCLLLPKTLTGPERDRFRDTFLSEGRLLHQLSRATAGIVQALDLGAAVSPKKHWTPYLVLEWLDGRPLDRDFAERRSSGTARSIPEAIELLGPAARALGIAHAQGIAHRDIKPANLFLANIAGGSVVKVLDFGIAKVMAESESVTRAFEVTGASVQAFTARYGAPEQFSRRYGATGPWTDVFSLALVFVEAVTNRHALDGTDAAQLFVAAADPERRPTLRNLGYPAPDAIEEVLSRALAVDPRERYASAADFWSALEAAAAQAGMLAPLSATRPGSSNELGLLPVRADVAPAPEPLGTAPTELSSSTHVASSGTAGPPSRRSGSFGLLITLGTAALLTGAVGTFALRSALRERVEDSELVGAVPSGGVAEVGSEDPEPGDAPPNAPAPTNAARAAAQPLTPPAATTAAGPAANRERTPERGVTPAVFEGVPERNITAGPVGDSYIGAFRVLVREGAVGLDFASASRHCADAGMALCTESQWARACESFPEIARVPSWTSTVAEDGVVVRGGGQCTTTGVGAPDEADASRYGLCCERAIAMTTSNLQKQYLSTTAQRVLLVERAMNQRNVPALLELSQDRVVIDGQTKTQAQLKKMLESDFRTAPDLVVLNDVCNATVQAKKVTKRVNRRKKVVYETQGWTAECRQTAILAGQVTSRTIKYAFDAKSQLREIRTKPE